MSHENATPRPWIAHDPEGCGGDAIMIGRADNEPIAAVEPVDIEDDAAHAVQIANARLIVEAANNHDRLIEENKRLRAALERITNLYEITVGQSPRDNEAIDQARAALEQEAS